MVARTTTIFMRCKNGENGPAATEKPVNLAQRKGNTERITVSSYPMMTNGTQREGGRGH